MADERTLEEQLADCREVLAAYDVLVDALRAESTVYKEQLNG